MLFMLGVGCGLCVAFLVSALFVAWMLLETVNRK